MFIRDTPWEIPFESFGDKFYFMLMSDLHIGSSGTNYDLIKRDLETARHYGARILLDGDVLDLILPSDRKRYDPSSVHPRLRNRSDVVNEQVRMAFEILEPYADLIDIVGIGNHETSVEKYHNTDPAGLLVGKFRDKGFHHVEYGQYEGWAVYNFKRTYENSTDQRMLKIRYHHGFGGGAPVTKGIVDFSRWSGWVENADVLWMGHKHNRFIDWQRKERISSRGRVEYYDCMRVMTGAYYSDRKSQSTDSVINDGRKGSWAHQMGFSPQTTGGVLLEVSPIHYDRGRLSIKAIA